LSCLVTEVFDEASRPRVAGKVTLTPQQRAAGDHLRDVHNMFRAQLEQLVASVAAVRHGEGKAADVQRDIAGVGIGLNQQMVGGLCAQVCRYVTMHHTLEDQALFPQVGALDTYAPVAKKLAEEHVVIHEHLVHMQGVLARLGSTPEVFDELDVSVTQLQLMLESHFTYEEVELSEPMGLYRMFG